MSYGIKGIDGAVGLPAWTFANDADSGFYRIGPDNLGLSLGGTKRWDFGTAGSTLTGTFTLSGAATLQSTLAVTGAATLSSTLSVGGNVTLSANNALALRTLADFDTSDDGNAIVGGTAGGSTPFDLIGSLVLQARARAGRHIIFATGATPAERGRITDGGIWAIGTTATTGAAVGGMKVAGASIFDSTLTITGAATLSSTLAVTGVATLSAEIVTNAGIATHWSLQNAGSERWRILTKGTETGSNAGSGFSLDAYDDSGVRIGSAMDFMRDDMEVFFGGRIVTVSSTTTRSGFRLPHGSAPSSPVNGDVWTTTAGLFVRIDGATVGPLS